MKLKTLKEFDEIRDNLIKKFNPSTGVNLDGMEIDFDYYLDSSKLFNTFEIRKSSNKKELIVAKCFLKKSVNLQLALSKLEEIWEKELSYQAFEAHFIEIKSNGFTLHFITQIAIYRFYVTGRIMVNYS